MIKQEDILYGTISTSGRPGPQGPPGPPGGVLTWNGRDGEVLPEMDDYTYEQVGAFPATEVLTNSDILAIWQDS